MHIYLDGLLQLAGVHNIYMNKDTGGLFITQSVSAQHRKTFVSGFVAQSQASEVAEANRKA